MPERPEKDVLLDAVGRFLDEIRPLITDPRLAFRVLIAQSLTSIVASEIRQGDAHDQAELARLSALLPDRAAVFAPGAPTGARIRALRAVLATELRLPDPIDADRMKSIRDHIRTTLAEKLAISNPRFDLRPEIE